MRTLSSKLLLRLLISAFFVGCGGQTAEELEAEQRNNQPKSAVGEACQYADSCLGDAVCVIGTPSDPDAGFCRAPCTLGGYGACIQTDEVCVELSTGGGSCLPEPCTVTSCGAGTVCVPDSAVSSSCVQGGIVNGQFALSVGQEGQDVTVTGSVDGQATWVDASLGLARRVDDTLQLAFYSNDNQAIVLALPLSLFPTTSANGADYLAAWDMPGNLFVLENDSYRTTGVVTSGEINFSQIGQQDGDIVAGTFRLALTAAQ